MILATPIETARLAILNVQIEEVATWSWSEGRGAVLLRSRLAAEHRLRQRQTVDCADPSFEGDLPNLSVWAPGALGQLEDNLRVCTWGVASATGEGSATRA